MKKSFLLILMGLPFVLFSQSLSGPAVVYGLSAMRYKSFGQFVDSYNAYYKPEKELKNFPLLQSFEVSGHFKYVHLGYQRNWGSTSTTVGDLQRQFDFLRDGLKIGFGTVSDSYNEGGRFWVCGDLGLITGRSSISSSTIYPDGTQSWGYEKNLNGEFTQFVLNPYLDWSFNLGFGHHVFFLKADIQFPTVINFDMNDNHGSNPPFMMRKLPTDIEAYYADTYAYDWASIDSKEMDVRNKYMMIGLWIGYSFRILTED